ncbi:MAG: hypothetical protein J6S65_03205, partial [Bacteroidaceae bacterium]|nr:hypothetical protein [Bacteroidaceae bacterium]
MEGAGKALKIGAANSRKKSASGSYENKTASRLKRYSLTTQTLQPHDSNVTASQLKRYSLTTQTLQPHDSNVTAA